MTTSEPLFEPPLAAAGSPDPGSAAAAAAAEPAKPRESRLRAVGLPVALAAAGLVAGAALTGVALADDGGAAVPAGASVSSTGGGPALTIPDQDSGSADDGSTGFTLPDRDGDGGRDGDRGTPPDGAGAPGGHTSTGASA